LSSSKSQLTPLVGDVMTDSNPDLAIYEVDIGVIEVLIIQFLVLGVVFDIMSGLFTLGKNDFATISDIFLWTGSPLMSVGLGLAYLFDHNLPDPRSD